MAEYVKILSGATHAKMLNSEFRKYVQLTRSETSPGEGWWSVEKVLPKPVPGEGQELAYEYDVVDGVARKTYFLVAKGTNVGPRRFSKLKLYAALAQAGLWDPLVAWLNSQTFEGINAYTAFTLAQDLAEDNPLFDQWLAAAKTALGVSDADAEAILAAAAE